MRSLLALAGLLRLAVSISVVPSLQHIPAGVRAACRTTLAKNMTECSEAFHDELKYIPSSSLSEICTTGCANALSSLYSEASTRCGTDSVNITVNGTLLATFRPLDLVGELRYKYNLTCLKDKLTLLTLPLREGGFCKDKLADVADDEMCSDCYLQSVQLGINQPIGDSPVNRDEFNDLKESCGIPTTSYPVTPTPTGTPPEETSTCATTHTAKAGDTINSIAKSLSVATDRLLAYNDLPLSLDEPFKGGEELCLDQVSGCFVHQVASQDTCSSLRQLAGSQVDELMLRSWNPTIGTDCSNLKFMVGKYICIGPPGQTTTFVPVVPSTTTPPVITTPPDTYTWEPAPDTLTSSVNITTTWLFPEPASDLVPTQTPSLPSVDDSQAIIERLQFCPFTDELNETVWDQDLEDEEYHLHSWDLDFECTDEYWAPYCLPAPDDPILPSPTDIPSSCLPTITTIIPDGWVDPPGPTQSGIPDNCNKWHLLQNGDSCAGVAAKYGLTVAEFHALNPSINEQCGNLRAAFAVCVRTYEEAPPTTTTTTTAGPPGPTSTGTSPTCTKWHLLKQGDSCDSIIAEYGIILSRFRQLNRSVDSTCSNLVVGNAYCVG